MVRRERECVTYNIEYGRERASNIVEGHAQILESEIVEDDHTNKHH